MFKKLMILVCWALASCATNPREYRLEQLQACISQTPTTKTRRSSEDVAAACRPKVMPDVERSSLEGGLSQQEVVTVFKAHLKKFDRCYESALDQTADIAGVILFAWNIDALGKVKNLSVNEAKTDISDARLINCMTKVMRKSQFPKPRNGVKTTVQYPFRFTLSPKSAASLG